MKKILSTIENITTTLDFIESNILILKQMQVWSINPLVENGVVQCFQFLEININSLIYEGEEIGPRITNKAKEFHQQFLELAKERKYELPDVTIEFLKKRPMLRKEYEKKWQAALVTFMECFDYAAILLIIMEFLKLTRIGDNYKFDKTSAIFDNANYTNSEKNEIFHLFLVNEVPYNILLKCIAFENWIKMSEATREIQSLNEINSLQKFVYNVNI